MNMGNPVSRFSCIFTSFLLLISIPVWAEPMGTAFTYQGELKQAGIAADGNFDFQFNLFNVENAGAPIAPAVLKNDASVSNGIFTVKLDFGSSPFSGQKLWLEIGVRTGAVKANLHYSLHAKS